MVQTGSNHASNGVEIVKKGQIMGQTDSNHGSIRVDRAEKGGVMSRAGSNHGSNLGQIMSITGPIKPNIRPCLTELDPIQVY